MKKGMPAPRGRLAGWVVIRERADRVDYYRGPLFGDGDRWSPDPADALGYALRSVAHHALTDYIDTTVDKARIVPVWLDIATRRSVSLPEVAAP